MNIICIKRNGHKKVWVCLLESMFSLLCIHRTLRVARHDGKEPKQKASVSPGILESIHWSGTGEEFRWIQECFLYFKNA